MLPSTGSQETRGTLTAALALLPLSRSALKFHHLRDSQLGKGFRLGFAGSSGPGAGTGRHIDKFCFRVRATVTSCHASSWDLREVGPVSPVSPVVGGRPTNCAVSLCPMSESGGAVNFVAPSLKD